MDVAKTGERTGRYQYRCRFRTPNSRKTTRWLPAALSYHYAREPGAKNEIVVLALGIDQYLQEVFQRLDFKKQGKLNADHFKALCEVLDFQGGDILKDLPRMMSFRQFHARLGEHVADKHEMDYKPPDSTVKDEEEYISTDIRHKESTQSSQSTFSMERPLKPKFGTFPKQITVYKKCNVNSLNILDYPTGSLNRNPKWSKRGIQPKVVSDGRHDDRNIQGDIAKFPDGTNYLKRSGNEMPVKNSDREESECLREIIEDLRSALQSKDAECLAWQVALKHAQNVSTQAAASPDDFSRYNSLKDSHSIIPEKSSSQWTEAGKPVGRPKSGGYSMPNSLNGSSVVAKVAVMDTWTEGANSAPESKDQEIAKLMALVNHLQGELNETYKEVTKLERHNKLLEDNLDTLTKNYEMTRRLFEVAIVKVKELEREVATIPYLRETIVRLQEERDMRTKDRSRKRFRSRSRSNKFDDVMAFIRRGRRQSRSTDRKSPMGSSRNSVASEETIFCRDVEGKSGSDEEYVHSVGVSRWGSRMSPSHEESVTVAKLQECLASLNGRLYQMSQEKRRLVDELQCCKLRNNESRKELEGVEAERARLSVIEERLQESITLLRFLRGKFLSRRTLGKFLLDVVDESYDDPREEFVADKFVEKLLKKLTSSELLKEETYKKLPYSHVPKFSLPKYCNDSSGEKLFNETETLCVL